MVNGRADGQQPVNADLRGTGYLGRILLTSCLTVTSHRMTPLCNRPFNTDRRRRGCSAADTCSSCNISVTVAAAHPNVKLTLFTDCNQDQLATAHAHTKHARTTKKRLQDEIRQQNTNHRPRLSPGTAPGSLTIQDLGRQRQTDTD